MADALSGATAGMVTQGGVFVTAFLPVLGLLGGIGLAMWIALFARDFFRS